MDVCSITHDLPFDPRYGYSFDDLLAVSLPDNEPADFADFWQDTFAQQVAMPLQVESKPSTHQMPKHQVEEVFFSVLGGYRVGAYLCTPTQEPTRRLLVQGHGYGGRAAPQQAVQADCAVICPVAPGFHLSADDRLPLNDSQQHVLHGIADRESYIIRSCVAAIWAAATVLVQRFPDLADTLAYQGTSFGGGLGCLALPWDRRFTRAHFGLPTFCHMPLRLTCPCRGSGMAVTEYFTQHPDVLSKTLCYYDGAFAAKRLQVPAMFSLALFDPNVAPPGQFSAYNACPSSKSLCIQQVGHFDQRVVPKAFRKQQKADRLAALEASGMNEYVL